MAQQNIRIPFTKMQGAGNDFVILDNRSAKYSKETIADLAPLMCHRKFGVGADGIMALLPAELEEVDYTMFYLNPDGSDAGMCGNGGRCMALFACSLGFPPQHRFNVHDRTYEAEVKGHTVRLGFPIHTAIETLQVDGRSLFSVHTGTEHIVTRMGKTILDDEEFLRKEGRGLRYHHRFEPKGTNVNFIWGDHPDRLLLQTYERGVEDLTLACGTGAIASALVWHHLNDYPASGPHRFTVETKGGELTVYFSYHPNEERYAHIKLQGPAQFVFTGEYGR